MVIIKYYNHIIDLAKASGIKTTAWMALFSTPENKWTIPLGEISTEALKILQELENKEERGGKKRGISAKR